MSEHEAVFDIGASDYRVDSIEADPLGNTHVQVGRQHQGQRVYPSSLALWINPIGVLFRIRAMWPEVKEFPSAKLRISPHDLVDEQWGKPHAQTTPRLEYHLNWRGEHWEARLVWNIVVDVPRALEATQDATKGLMLDAFTGERVGDFPVEDRAGIKTTGFGVNLDELAASPERTTDVDDPGGGQPLTLRDTSRSVEIQTRNLAGATNTTGTHPLCSDAAGANPSEAFRDIVVTNRNDCDRPEVGAHFNTAVVHDYLESLVPHTNVCTIQPKQVGRAVGRGCGCARAS